MLWKSIRISSGTQGLSRKLRQGMKYYFLLLPAPHFLNLPAPEMQLKWLFLKKKKVLSAGSLSCSSHWFLQLNYKALTKGFNKGNADSFEWRQLGMVPIVIGDLAEQGQSVSMGEPLTSHDQWGIRPNLIVRIPQFMQLFSEDRILKLLNLKRAPYLLKEAFKKNWPPITVLLLAYVLII